jgi:hypothetical protein
MWNPPISRKEPNEGSIPTQTVGVENGSDGKAEETQSSLSGSEAWWSSLRTVKILRAKCPTSARPSANGTLTVDRSGIAWTIDRRPRKRSEAAEGLVEIPWRTVDGVEVAPWDGKTAGAVGLALVGAGVLLGTAASDRVVGGDENHILVSTGHIGVSFTTNKPLWDLREDFAIPLAHFAAVSTETTYSGTGIADEVRKLGELLDAGLLTQEECAAAKARIIGT